MVNSVIFIAARKIEDGYVNVYAFKNLFGNLRYGRLHATRESADTNASVINKVLYRIRIKVKS